jgi:hypothetical protein
MRLEYFDYPTSRNRSVLLLFGDDPNEARIVRDLISVVASTEPGVAVQVDAIPAVQGVDGCTLAAVVGDTDVGVELTGDGARAFGCSLRPQSWRTVAGLIEPFTTRRDRPASAFQYLTDAGSIDWIISTSRQW